MLKEAEQIRQQMAVLRSVMREEMERAFIAKSADLRLRLEDMAYDLYIIGTPVAKVGREIGTTNWRTVKDMIDNAEKRRGEKITTEYLDVLRIGRVTIDRGDAPAIDGYVVTAYDGWKNMQGERYVGSVRLWINPPAKFMGRMLPAAPEFDPAFEKFEPGSPLHREIAQWDDTSPVVQKIKAMEAEK